MSRNKHSRITHTHTHMDHSRHTYDAFGTPHTHMNHSRHTYETTMSRNKQSRVTHTHAYTCVISRICRSHVTNVNETCHTYE